MTTAYEIPVTSGANQEFDISLAGVTYHLVLVWNEASNCWTLTIQDSMQNNLVTSIPLVTGVDLLEQFGYLNFGGQLQVQSDHDPNLVPTFTSLGANGHLYFVTTP
jgi:hypothetical protein